jgi:hypothetical protein
MTANNDVIGALFLGHRQQCLNRGSANEYRLGIHARFAQLVRVLLKASVLFAKFLRYLATNDFGAGVVSNKVRFWLGCMHNPNGRVETLREAFCNPQYEVRRVRKVDCH